MSKTPRERIESACDNERIRYDLLDVLKELASADDLRELIQAAESFVDIVAEAEDAIETWHDEDEAEARADAREGALEALGNVLAAHEELSVWLQWPNAAEEAQEARLAAEAEDRAMAAARADDKAARMERNLNAIANASEDELTAMRPQFDPRSSDPEERELGIAVRARSLELWGEIDECFEIVSEPGAHPTIIELAARKRLEGLEP